MEDALAFKRVRILFFISLMKKLFIILVFALPLVGQAQVKREIFLSAPGTLASYISSSDKYTIEELTLGGEINGSDLRLLRDMAGNDWQGQLTEGQLHKIDLSGTVIVEGGKKVVDTKQIHYDKDGVWQDNISFNTSDDVLPPYTFMGCNSLREISLPKTITEIGNCAFALGLITKVSVPDGVRVIGQQAFYDCDRLTEFNMPESLVSIGNYAFAYCLGLTKISLPKGLTGIGKNAFTGSTNIRSVFSSVYAPFPITNKTFAVYDKATLYVPVGTKVAYQNTECWNMFQSIEEYSPTLVGTVSNKNEDKCEVYDLLGRKLNGSKKAGLYIVNGRKTASKM